MGRDGMGWDGTKWDTFAELAYILKIFLGTTTKCSSLKGLRTTKSVCFVSVTTKVIVHLVQKGRHQFIRLGTLHTTNTLMPRDKAAVVAQTLEETETLPIGW